MQKIITNNTQNKRVLEYMQEYGWITQFDALKELGIMRLASRISDLREMGVEVEKDWHEIVNRYGEVVRVRKYRLKETDNAK